MKVAVGEHTNSFYSDVSTSSISSNLAISAGQLLVSWDDPSLPEKECRLGSRLCRCLRFIMSHMFQDRGSFRISQMLNILREQTVLGLSQKKLSLCSQLVWWSIWSLCFLLYRWFSTTILADQDLKWLLLQRQERKVGYGQERQLTYWHADMSNRSIPVSISLITRHDNQHR